MNAVDHAWLQAIRTRALKPTPQILVADYADQTRILPTTNALPGQWQTSRTEYLREPLNCLSVVSPHERVVVMSGAQIGKTEIALNFINYLIANAPGTCLFVSPTVEASRKMVRLRLDPLIEQSPILSSLVARRRRAQPGNTESQKRYPGGFLFLVGANSGVGLRSTPAPYLVMDEVDAFPASAGHEGDPMSLAIARTMTYEGRRKILMLSTPTLKGISRIFQAFSEGDQRHFHCPCPFCGAFQVLHWSQLRWPPQEPQAAYYQCEACAKPIAEQCKAAMVQAGKWVPTSHSPTNTASFHLSALISPFVRWSSIVLEFQAAQADPARLQTWTNNYEGLPFEDALSTGLTPLSLMAKAADVTDPPIGVILAGCDLQIDRIEVLFLGVGRGEEAWILEYHSLPGSPAEPEVWLHLDELLLKKRYGLPVSACCIDSAYASNQAYAFTGKRFHRRVFSVRGTKDQTAPIWARKPSRPKDGRVSNLYTIGSPVLKDLILARLTLDKHGPGYIHLPVMDINFFEQLLNERPVRRYAQGTAKRVWVKPASARTEVRDCLMYSLAALYALKSYGFNLEKATANRQANKAGNSQSAPKKTMADFQYLNS